MAFSRCHVETSIVLVNESLEDKCVASVLLNFLSLNIFLIGVLYLVSNKKFIWDEFFIFENFYAGPFMIKDPLMWQLFMLHVKHHHTPT